MTVYIQKHSAAQVSELTLMIGIKSLRSRLSLLLSNEEAAGDESGDMRTSIQARHEYEDRCKSDARAAMSFEERLPWMAT